MNHDQNHEQDSTPVPDPQGSPLPDPLEHDGGLDELPEPERPRAATPREVDPTGAAGAWKVGRMLLAPLVAISAVCTHFVLNVPSEGTINENKRQAEDERKRQEAERRAENPAANEPYKPRSAAELARLETRYRGTPFAKEPLIPEWSRKAQSYINRAISAARKQAFEGMAERPTVSIRELRCRTIRCRFIVKASDQATADQFVRAFKNVRAQGRSVWRAFETKKTAGGGAKPTEIRVTVVLVEDQPDAKLLDGASKSAEASPPAAGPDGSGAPEAVPSDAAPPKAPRSPRAPALDLAAQGRSPAAKPRRTAPAVPAEEDAAAAPGKSPAPAPAPG